MASEHPPSLVKVPVIKALNRRGTFIEQVQRCIQYHQNRRKRVLSVSKFQHGPSTQWVQNKHKGKYPNKDSPTPFSLPLIPWRLGYLSGLVLAHASIFQHPARGIKNPISASVSAIQNPASSIKHAPPFLFSIRLMNTSASTLKTLSGLLRPVCIEPDERRTVN